MLSDSALLTTLAPAALACPLASVTPGLSLNNNVLGTYSMYDSVEATIGSTAGAAACVTEKVSTDTVDPISSITKAIPTQPTGKRGNVLAWCMLVA